MCDFRKSWVQFMNKWTYWTAYNLHFCTCKKLGPCMCFLGLVVQSLPSGRVANTNISWPWPWPWPWPWTWPWPWPWLLESPSAVEQKSQRIERIERTVCGPADPSARLELATVLAVSGSESLGSHSDRATAGRPWLVTVTVTVTCVAKINIPWPHGHGHGIFILATHPEGI